MPVERTCAAEHAIDLPCTSAHPKATSTLACGPRAAILDDQHNCRAQPPQQGKVTGEATREPGRYVAHTRAPCRHLSQSCGGVSPADQAGGGPGMRRALAAHTKHTHTGPPPAHPRGVSASTPPEDRRTTRFYNSNRAAEAPDHQVVSAHSSGSAAPCSARHRCLGQQ